MVEKDWFTVTPLNEQTYALSELGHWEKVHSFLLLGQTKALLIDTGLGIANIKEVVNRLTDLPIQVVTTHVHTDHIGGHGLFSDRWVHPLDKAWLEEGIQGLTLAQIRQDLVKELTQPLPRAFDVSKFKPFVGPATGMLHDKELLALGGRDIEVLHTPGHSPGHVTFFDKTYHLLFTGDLLYQETPIYAFYPSTDPKLLLASLARISKLKVKKIYGSHNTLGIEPSILLEVKKAVDFLRENDLDHFGTGLHEFSGFSIKF